MPDPQQFKERLCHDPFTHSCFISPSGNGVKVLARIAADKHQEHFLGLAEYYQEKYGQSIDIKCKDVSRLMFLSWDDTIFINDSSMIFDPLFCEVEKAILKIEANKTDITGSYDNWLSIGFAFSDSFRESGRGFFHRVSRFNPEYSEESCNKQFDNCLKSGGHGITIKTFFRLANNPGQPLRKEARNKVEIPKEEKKKNETSKFVMVENYLNKQFDFRYNEVSNEIEFKRKDESEFASMNENNIYRELQHQNIGFSINNLMALLRSDFVPPYNPIKDYFETLPKWDKREDHISRLCKFIMAKDQDRFNRHFKKMLVRSVACGLEQAFNKQVFILMGGQSSGKTTFCRWLCPMKLKNYYAENISTDKDSLISLTENFIINLDELATMQKIEINALKSMLTKDSVKIRRPYDKKPTIGQRRANFLGSTNKEEILTDETGTVRWLCFEITELDWDYEKEIDIDLVWSQAYFLFLNKFKYELTADEIEENEKINASHHVSTPELEMIQTYFEPSEKGKPLAEPFTATDIINRLRSTGITSITLSVQNIGRALTMLGIPRVSERVGDSKTPKKVYWLRFIPPTTTTTSS